MKAEVGINQHDIQTTLAFDYGLTLLTLIKEEWWPCWNTGVERSRS